MADSTVDVTQGTGTSIDTRTEATNGNHRQVVVIGDPDTNAGVAPVDAAAGLKVDLGADNDIQGMAAHDAVASGKPVLIGGRAATSAPTAVAVGDAVQAWFGLNGQRAVAFGPTSFTAADGVSNVVNGTPDVQGNVVRTPVRAELYNGTTWDRIRGNATNGLQVYSGVAAADLGKAEDAAHTTGDTGVMALAVRTDTLSASSGTTGDYEALHTDSIGALFTRDTATLVDDAAFTPATSRVMPIGMQADETATDSVDEGDIGAPRMTLNRKQIVTVRSITGALANVAASATSVTVLAANTSREGATIWNDSTAILYLKFGATASVTSATVKMIADSYFEVPFGYTGIIDGIWASATGNARVTEIT